MTWHRRLIKYKTMDGLIYYQVYVEKIMMTKRRNWLVIAGGPGISSNYLYCLDDVFKPDNLIFYDQIGTHDCPLVFQSLDQMVNQLHSVVKENNLTSFGVITHSFGNYLLMEYIKKYGQRRINSIIMITPCPLLYNEWVDSIHMLTSYIPKKLMDDYAKMKKISIDGSDLFKLIYPYYTKDKRALDIDVKFNADLCEKISSSVEEFDHRQIHNSLKSRLFLITGEHDFFNKPNHFKNCRIFNMPNTGHYPHLENFESFKVIVTKIMSNLY